jgi:23S rRNA (cytidine1920-2'-O)/16S rRNA (cytidine1409-2'-O)-methyltransferase
MAGEVSVNGQPVIKPGTRVPADSAVDVRTRPRFASRGGEKLAAALTRFGLDVAGRICADVGASTGGFTDCLLQAGAAKVYAIDVGYGQLAWELRNDPRVVVMERVNARYLVALPDPIDLACMDVSFISVRYLFPRIHPWLVPGGQAVILVKPQFEAGRKEVRKGGVVRHADVHRRVLAEVVMSAQESGFGARGIMPSPLVGPAGNVEFLLWLGTDPTHTIEDVATLIESAVTEAHTRTLGGAGI